MFNGGAIMIDKAIKKIKSNEFSYFKKVADAEKAMNSIIWGNI
jgi:hypothetical protein